MEIESDPLAVGMEVLGAVRGNAEAAGRFEERMLMIETFWSAWLALYDRFLDLRTDTQAWPKTLDAMRQWIARFGES